MVAAVLAFAGLLLAVSYYRNDAKRADAEAALARDQRDRAIEAVKASEAANQKLKQLNAALDKAIVDRDQRARALEEAKRRISKELDELRKALPQEDQDCLARALPDVLAERLRLN